MADREAMAHLLRRATFGPTAEEVDAAERAGLQATLDRLLTGAGTADRGAQRTPVPVFATDPYASLPRQPTREQKQQAKKARQEQIHALIGWWLARMVAADRQLTEKMVFFWHGHWATSVQKARSATLMLRQLETFRRDGFGDFATLTKSMVVDPALILWLDGQRNTSRAPNENLARELMELFTLGIGSYTEADVKAAARALTGWTIDRRTGQATLNQRRHDAGSKTVLGQTADFTAVSLAELLATQPAAPAFLAGRLWLRFGSGDPLPSEVRQRLVAAYGPRRDITAMLRTLFADPGFVGTRGQLVKQPIEWLIGAARQLGIRPESLPAQQAKQLLGGLDRLGQVPLRPPSVGGWPADVAWLTTSALQARLQLAQQLATQASTTIVQRLAEAPASGRATALARLLVVDAWTDRTAQALRKAGDDPRKLIAVGLVSPEYAVH